MALKFIKGEEVEKNINSKGYTLVNVYADWCGPCKMMAPVFEAIAEDGIDVYKINLDQNREFAIQKQISGVPTTFIYKDGKEIDVIVGFTSKDYIYSKMSD